MEQIHSHYTTFSKAKVIYFKFCCNYARKVTLSLRTIASWLCNLKVIIYYFILDFLKVVVLQSLVYSSCM